MVGIGIIEHTVGLVLGCSYDLFLMKYIFQCRLSDFQKMDFEAPIVISETILAREPRLPLDSQHVTQPSATQGCLTVPLLAPFIYDKKRAERKHHRRVKRLKEASTSLHRSKQSHFPTSVPFPSTRSFALWLHPSKNRSLISTKKLTNSSLLSMRSKRGQNRTWSQSATRRIISNTPGWFLSNLRDPSSFPSISPNAFASFPEERVATNEFSKNSPYHQNFESVINQQSPQRPAIPQDFQGSAKKQRQQVDATGRNQPSPQIAIIQRLLSLIQTFSKDEELMESSFSRAGSTEIFPQSSPSNFEIHSEAHMQTRKQKPFEISNFLNVLGLNYDANLHDSGHEHEFISDALPPAPPLELPLYPNSQPFIPAYHQVSLPSPPNVVQDSLAPASQSPPLSSISLISSVVSNPTSCFEDTLCTIGVAFMLALSASGLILLPFSQGRRKRSLEDRTHDSEGMMVSGLLQGLGLE